MPEQDSKNRARVRGRATVASANISRMRKVLVFVVCFVLGLQGLAQARVMAEPCPIQRTGSVQAMHGPGTPRCCNDADQTTKTGRACKLGQECPVAGAWLPSAQDSWVPVRATDPAASSFEPFALCIDPRGRWRPPALS